MEGTRAEPPELDRCSIPTLSPHRRGCRAAHGCPPMQLGCVVGGVGLTDGACLAFGWTGPSGFTEHSGPEGLTNAMVLRVRWAGGADAGVGRRVGAVPFLRGGRAMAPLRLVAERAEEGVGEDERSFGVGSGGWGEDAERGCCSCFRQWDERCTGFEI